MTLGHVAVAVVDESAWPAGLSGTEKEPTTLSLDSLEAGDTVPDDPVAGQRLRFLRGMASEALRGAGDGPVLRAAMKEAGMTAMLAGEARTLEWRRKVDPGMEPAMPAAERRAAARAAEGNWTINRLSMFWQAIEALVQDGGPDASGWAALARADTPEGQVRVLHLKGRQPIRDGWQAPTLIIDAILNIDLVRPIWPTVELVADVAAETPHQRIRQVVDRSYSKAHLDARDAPDETKRRKRTRHLRNLNATLATIGRSYAPSRTLVVTQKAIEEALPHIGVLPPSVVVAHHNNIAGRDEWGDVAALVVVGRTAPSPRSVERIAEALTGAAVPPQAGWYPRVASGREMADGRVIPAEVDRHPDPVCEAVRWHICEGELVQIIGRGRGVNRKAGNPVDVLVLTDAPLPLPLDGILDAADLNPSPMELMLGTGGIAFENATDAATAYSQFWSDREAAKKARARAAAVQMGTLWYKRLSIPKCPHLASPEPVRLRRVDYQRSGARLSRSVAWYDPAVVTDPPMALVMALGLVSWCSVEVAAEPEPAALPTVSATEPSLKAAYEEIRMPDPTPPAAPPEATDAVVTLPPAYVIARGYPPPSARPG